MKKILCWLGYHKLKDKNDNICLRCGKRINKYERKIYVI